MKKLSAFLVLCLALNAANCAASTHIEMKDYKVSDDGKNEFLMGCQYSVYRNGDFMSNEYATYSCAKAMRLIQALYSENIKDEKLSFTLNGHEVK